MKQTRATFVIDPVLLRKFKQFAKDNNETLSALVEQGITKVLQDADGDDLDKQYDALLKMAGRDVSHNQQLDNLSVDEVLYGDYDGWRGHEE